MLKNISDYSHDEIDKACEFSSAIKRYLPLIKQKSDGNFYNDIVKKRHSYWVQSALAEILSSDTTENICNFWSQKTIEILNEVWNKIEHNQNLALFALGKLGANELNLSSDIDILIVSKQPASQLEFKFYREFYDFLSKYDELGFCYRLDFNLKPGGRLGPTICSIKQFEDYYWTQGATWERIALNRLSPICGNNDVISNVIKIKNKFCYRKFLDFSLLEDIQNIRTHINFNEAGEVKKNIKLCAGGIRDIELYVNSLQVIHGGKLPDLQTTITSEAIKKLTNNNILKPEDADFLNKTYWAYRKIENIVQSTDDQQTHYIDQNSIHYNAQSLPFKKVDTFVSRLIGDKPKLNPLLPDSIENQIQWLLKNNFDQELVQRIWPQIIKLTVLSKNNQLDEIFRSRFLFKFISNVIEFGLDKNLSLNLLHDFIKSIRPKKSFYHLLEQEQYIIKELAIILSSSPYLGNLLTSRPELLDSFLLKTTENFSDEIDKLLPQLIDYKQLNQLLVSSQLLTNKNIFNLTETCSVTADKICSHLLNTLKLKFPSNSIDIIKLGKWGGHDLGLLSDLDFIFFTENEINEDDIKISRRFINYITNRQQGGEIYEIDMRLRPQSGTGAIITTKARLINYIKKSAKPWEAQSFLRATPLNDNSFKELILTAVYQRVFSNDTINELVKIKNQVIDENYNNIADPTNSIDFKYSPGGLVDIEFSTQLIFLKNKILPSSSNTLKMIKQLGLPDNLYQNYSQLRYFEQISQILTQNQSTFVEFDDKNFIRLAKHLGKGLPQIKLLFSNILSNNIKHLSDSQ